MKITDKIIISRLVHEYAIRGEILEDHLNLKNRSSLNNYIHHGIPAKSRATIWLMMENYCPDLIKKLNKNKFLGIDVNLKFKR